MLDTFTKARKSQVDKGAFLPAGDPMAQRIGSFDWARTSLGDIGSWDSSLRDAIRALLACPGPACLWWGSDFINIPNAGCLSLLGPMQATALGVPARAAWGESWREIERRLDAANATGTPGIDDARDTAPLALSIDRGGVFAEAHFAVTLLPMGASGRDDRCMLGIFGDVTPAVMAMRERALLQEIVARGRGGFSIADACEAAARAVAADPHDFPFAGIYLSDDHNACATLAAVAGIEPGDPLMPRTLRL